jgi:hypothetical protein
MAWVELFTGSHFSPFFLYEDNRAGNSNINRNINRDVNRDVNKDNNHRTCDKFDNGCQYPYDRWDVYLLPVGW